jgi:hypothetical protein
MNMTLEEAMDEIFGNGFVFTLRPKKALEALKVIRKALLDYGQLKADCIDIDKQLRTANTENDELKRLLRLAVDDFQTAMLEEKCKVCALEHCDYDEICKWRHHDEAMKLLGGNENDND